MDRTPRDGDLIVCALTTPGRYALALVCGGPDRLLAPAGSTALWQLDNLPPYIAAWHIADLGRVGLRTETALTYATASLTRTTDTPAPWLPHSQIEATIRLATTPGIHQPPPITDADACTYPHSPDPVGYAVSYTGTFRGDWTVAFLARPRRATVLRLLAGARARVASGAVSATGVRVDPVYHSRCLHRDPEGLAQ